MKEFSQMIAHCHISYRYKFIYLITNRLCFYDENNLISIPENRAASVSRLTKLSILTTN